MPQATTQDVPMVRSKRRRRRTSSVFEEVAERVLFIDDEPDARGLVELGLSQRGFDVTVAASAPEALRILETDHAYDVVLSDIRLGEMSGLDLCQEISERHPEIPVVLITAYGEMEVAVSALRRGAEDFVQKPFDLATLQLVLRRVARDRRLREEVEQLSAIVAAARAQHDIIGESPKIREILSTIDSIADSPTTVLISGESGTGKELVARAIHRASTRAGEMVAINCAAMPPALLESELFGHARGAFTDARKARPGLFVQANGGTIFLDEIGEMPMDMQVKLLRVLQERKIRPVGGDKEVEVDVRVIAATNRDLSKEVEAGRFREDLFYRIHVVPVPVPPLRDRGDDVLLLAQAFVERTARRLGKEVTGIAPDAAAKLLEYDWPGNVRELENCIERAVSLTRYREVIAEDLPDKIRDRDFGQPAVPLATPGEPMPTLAEVERRYVTRVLAAVGGKKTQAAEVLGMDRRTLYRKIAKLEIDESEFASAPDVGAANSEDRGQRAFLRNASAAAAPNPTPAPPSEQASSPEQGAPPTSAANNGGASGSSHNGSGESERSRAFHSSAH